VHLQTAHQPAGRPDHDDDAHLHAQSHAGALPRPCDEEDERVVVTGLDSSG
jgi:hypothetical protein